MRAGEQESWPLGPGDPGDRICISCICVADDSARPKAGGALDPCNVGRLEKDRCTIPARRPAAPAPLSRSLSCAHRPLARAGRPPIYPIYPMPDVHGVPCPGLGSRPIHPIMSTDERGSTNAESLGLDHMRSFL